MKSPGSKDVREIELCVLDARTVRRVIPSFGELACRFRRWQGREGRVRVRGGWTRQGDTVI